MFKRFLSGLLSSVLPADKLAALQSVARASAEEAAAATQADMLVDKLWELSGGRGEPGLNRTLLEVRPRV